MGNRKIYQTVENRSNPDDVESIGPFICNRSDAWLGNGYYYWDHFIENAHWWGEKSYPSQGYMICESSCILTENNCFDLVGNTDHLEWLRYAIDELVSKGASRDGMTVARVIEFLRNEAKIFKFQATRANSINARYKDSEYEKRIHFSHRYEAYMDYQPPIQICFYEKTACSLIGYKIVYPIEYVDGYAV